MDSSILKEIETALDKYDEIVIRKDANNKIIIMSIEEYKKELFMSDLAKKLEEAEDDIKNGRVRNAREVFEEWKEKYHI